MDDYKEHKSMPKKAPAPPAPTGIKNVSGRRHKVYGQIVQPGETYTMTDADKADDRSGQRVKNGIAAGKLERV
jgi:hypothetical protein